MAMPPSVPATSTRERTMPDPHFPRPPAPTSSRCAAAIATTASTWETARSCITRDSAARCSADRWRKWPWPASPPASPCGSTPIPGYPGPEVVACAFPARRERLPAPEQQLRALLHLAACCPAKAAASRCGTGTAIRARRSAGRCGWSRRIARPIARPIARHIAASGHRRGAGVRLLPARAATRPAGPSRGHGEAFLNQTETVGVPS